VFACEAVSRSTGHGRPIEADLLDRASLALNRGPVLSVSGMLNTIQANEFGDNLMAADHDAKNTHICIKTSTAGSGRKTALSI
jgi:hypothetical protein